MWLECGVQRIKDNEALKKTMLRDGILCYNKWPIFGIMLLWHQKLNLISIHQRCWFEVFEMVLFHPLNWQNDFRLNAVCCATRISEIVEKRLFAWRPCSQGWWPTSSAVITICIIWYCVELCMETAALQLDCLV